ncbi:MAG: ATP-binding protein [Thermodesulfobacteriota bacterium]
MTKRRRLIWQLYPSYLLITLFSLLAVSWYTSASMKRFLLERTAAELTTQGNLLKEMFQQHVMPLEEERIDRACKRAAASTVTRLTVILPDGKVAGDSEAEPASMENHGDRPEVRKALAGKTSSAVRYSTTLEKNLMYVAIPIVAEDSVAAILRVSSPIEAMEKQLNSIRLRIALGGLFMAGLAAGICLLVSRRIVRPIEYMKQGVEQFARGDLKRPLLVPDTLELAGLAESMNAVAVQLENRIETVINQKNEYESVLASMMEGVIALDMNECIISINQAAMTILGQTTGNLKGRRIQELTRSSELYQFVSDAISTGKLTEGDIVFHADEERIVHTQSIPLRNAVEKCIGTLLVLNDVTQLRQLETIRRDFVANVSHEIKTPLTAIKGFVETLLQDRVDSQAEAHRFLTIIDKHVDRLSSIVEDLLSLARIEQKGGPQEINLESKRLKTIMETAIQVIQPKAEEKHIAIQLDCDDSLCARLDATLMDQALVNLIDNAVKYSPEGGSIHLRAGIRGMDIAIMVTDNGPGIPQKHLPRLFERFYRVDKARSRKLGGTGLGLAIVKHAVQSHGGQVSVESAVGKGTTFEIRLPQSLLEK